LTSGQPEDLARLHPPIQGVAGAQTTGAASRDQFEEIARGIATEEGELPEGDDLQRVLDASAGLTRFEAEGAYSLSLVRHRRIEPHAVWELKAGMLRKSGLLMLHRGASSSPPPATQVVDGDQDSDYW